MDRRRKGDSDTQVLGCIFNAIVVLLALLVIPAMVGGTFRTQVAIPVPAAAGGSGVKFSEDLTARHWVGGLVKGEQPDIGRVVGKHVRKGEQLARLSVTTRHTWVNNLVMLVTLGIYDPVTVTVEGEVAKAESPR